MSRILLTHGSTQCMCHEASSSFSDVTAWCCVARQPLMLFHSPPHIPHHDFSLNFSRQNDSRPLSLLHAQTVSGIQESVLTVGPEHLINSAHLLKCIPFCRTRGAPLTHPHGKLSGTHCSDGTLPKFYPYPLYA